MSFGDNFRRARKEMNLTQLQVARKLNINQSSVSDWENDVSRPDYEKLIELSSLYEISIDELLTGKTFS